MTKVTVTVPAKTVTAKAVKIDVPAQQVTQDVTVEVPAYDIEVDVPDAPPTPTPSTKVPLVASIDHGGGRPPAADLFDQYLKNGYNGWVEYQTPANPTKVSGTMTTIKNRHGTEKITMQQTCRTHSDSGLQAVLAWLPDPWRETYIYNYFQEPEDNLEGDSAGQKAYRDTYTAAAKVIRAYNQANPAKAVSLPWLELQEYALALLYVNGNPSRSPALYKPPDGDFAGVLWSCFEYQDNSDPARLQAKIDRITRAMKEFFPGKPWGIMGANFPLKPVSGDDTSVGTYAAAYRQQQAAWLTMLYNKAVAAGCKQWAWYNVKFIAAPPAGGEGRVEVIPETLAAFKALPR